MFLMPCFLSDVTWNVSGGRSRDVCPAVFAKDFDIGNLYRVMGGG